MSIIRALIRVFVTAKNYQTNLVSSNIRVLEQWYVHIILLHIMLSTKKITLKNIGKMFVIYKF